VILADIGLLDYASQRHPALRLHLSVQGSATSYEAVNFATASSASGARCCRAC
jgi:collagenase-like PrtC family protease